MGVGRPQLERPAVQPGPQRFLFNVPVFRKAPWLLYLFMFCVAVGIAIMCVRLQLGDDMLAIICASVTCGLILATAVCVYFSIRKEQVIVVPEKRKRVTVTLRAQTFTDAPDYTCHICLTDLEKGDRATELECGHVFHVDCASNWVKRVAQCPACRFKLPTMLVSVPPSGHTSPRDLGTRGSEIV